MIPRQVDAQNQHARSTDGHATEGATAAAAPIPAVTSLATLLASHILRDGELVLLILKPSVWFIIFACLRFTAIVIVLAIAAALFDRHLNGRDHVYFEIASVLVCGRLMWAVLQWMGRLYILTDMRILRLAGVFSIDVFDCPLRKVVRTRMVSPLREKLVVTGSIEIIPRDETMPVAIWQTVARPVEVHEQVVAAINKAKQTGHGCD